MPPRPERELSLAAFSSEVLVFWRLPVFGLMTTWVLTPCSNRYLTFIFLFASFSLVLALFPLSARAQFETVSVSHVAKLIDSEAAAVIHVGDFPELLRAVVTHSAFQNPDFSNLIKSINGNNPEFGARLNRFTESLETVKQAHLIVWASQPTDRELNRDDSVAPDWANSEIAILINSTKPIAVSEAIGFLEGFFSTAGRQVANEDNESTPEKGDGHCTLTTIVHGEWVIAASSADRATQLKKLFAGSSTVDRSLMTHRNYLLVLEQFKKMTKPTIVAHVKPERFPWLFGLPNEEKESVEMSLLSETPAAGFGLSFLDDPNAVLIKAITTCTLPESGLALEWTARRKLPRPLPHFEFVINDVTAEAWDPEALASAQRENIDRVRGDRSYEKSLENEFRHELAGVVDRRSSARYTITYTGPDGMRDLVVMDQVANWDAMRMYLEYEVKSNNEGKSKDDIEFLTSRDDFPETDPTAIVYGASVQNREKHIRESLQLAKTSPRSKTFLETLYKPAIDNGDSLEKAIRTYAGSRGRVLTKEWLFDGHVERIFQQIDATNANTTKASGIDSINDQVEWLTMKSETDWPVLLWYGKIIIWKLKHVGWEVLRQKYTGSDREYVARIWNSVSKYGSENESEGDLYDVLSWHIIEIIVHDCSGVLISCPEKPVGTPTQTTVFGVFFKEENGSRLID